MIREVNGNLITMAQNGKFDVIIHGCNCYSTMGAGFALQIKNTFPSAYKVDKALPNGISKLGKFSCSYETALNGLQFLIINAYTQLNYGSPGTDFDINAYIKVMKALTEFLNTDLLIGIPKIGCGLGKGNWNEVLAISDPIFENHNVTVVNYDGV